MSKTNDIARADRALKDVIRQGLSARHPQRIALQARLDRLKDAQPTWTPALSWEAWHALHASPAVA